MLDERFFYDFHGVRMGKSESRRKQMILLIRLKYAGHLAEQPVPTTQRTRTRGLGPTARPVDTSGTNKTIVRTVALRAG